MTIYDVAELVGVSPSTVSRVLNGKPGVGKEKRELIQRVLEENHYIPDQTARSLVMSRTHTVGLLTDDLDSKHQNEAVARCQNELVIHGYQSMTRYIGGESDGMEKAIAELGIRKVEGALFFGLSFLNHERVEKAIEKWLPQVPIILVYQSERIERSNVYCIGSNEQKGFYYCINRFVEQGRKNLVLMVEKKRASRVKVQSYFEKAMAMHPEMSYKIYTEVKAGSEIAEAMVERIFMELPEVDGIFCTQDRLAIEVMYAIEKRGKRVPEDVSIMGEGDGELCEVCRPKLTSLNTMVGVCAMMSVRMLIDVMEGRSQTHKIVLDMELAERGSL